MLKNRIILVAVSAALIILLFLLPKVVVNNDSQTASISPDSTQKPAHDPHSSAPEGLLEQIAILRSEYQAASGNQKSAIFADSLAGLYAEAGKFDSAAWYSEKAADILNNEKSWMKAGDQFYQAYTFAMDEGRQNQLAEKAQTYFTKVLEANPTNLEAKTKMAMTYLSSPNPMQGIMMLREVLAQDPQNELALFNLGMLSIQSGQNDLAIQRLTELVEVNPRHIQGQLLLGIAYMNTGNKEKARKQFEKVKEMDTDPAVQATVDSYLKDLK